jgi:hypothetical protein
MINEYENMIEKGGSFVVMEMNESSACCHCYLLQGYISFQVLLEPDDQRIRLFLLGILVSCSHSGFILCMFFPKN